MPRETKLINGVETSQVPQDVRYAMQMLLPMVRAQKRIHDGNYNELDSEGSRALFMLAYDDEEIAEAAELRALQALINQNCKRETR